jgi:tetratricopeptide (TPR) repeat protein
MYNILISAGIMVVSYLVLTFAAGLSWWLSLVISLLLFMGVFYLISRIVMKKVMAIMEYATKDLQAQRVEKGIRELQRALPYGKWQIYVTGQVNSQIGMVYYMKRDFTAAFPYLEKSFFKNWVAMGMLAISYMKRHKKDKMKETFDKAIQGSPKEALIWNLYAYCLCEINEPGKAKETLEKGLKKVSGDEKTRQNLELLQEGKKMKMKGFGEMWLQFHLESIGTIQKQQLAAMGGMKRRIVRR